METEACTVFVIDDEPAVRKSLSRLLITSGYRVRSFESAEIFLAQQDPAVPGCLLLDVCLPGLSGMELQRSLIASPRARPIVFLTGRSDIQIGVDAMKAGAVDFLTKPIDGKLLVAAIDQALRLDAERRLESAIRTTIQRRFDALTPRERQVMEQVIRGRLNKQIAADLGAGEKTIKVHRGRVMSKMQVRSVPELVRLGAWIGIALEAALRDPRLHSSGRRPDVQISTHWPVNGDEGLFHQVNSLGGH
jgi:FixJ family two-component response regulator